MKKSIMTKAVSVMTAIDLCAILCCGYIVTDKNVQAAHAAQEQALIEQKELEELNVQDISDQVVGEADLVSPFVLEKPEPIEPDPVEITEVEEAYDEYQVYSDDTYYSAPSYSTYGGSGYSSDFKSAGVVYENGIRYTWYSQRVLPGNGLTELNNNGRTVNDSGFVVDGDGYIAVASPDYARGTVVSTPYGDGKVYDTGCASGTIDIYTDF